MKRLFQSERRFASAAAVDANATSHYGRLIRFVHRQFKLRDEAADVVQDAYVRLAVAEQRCEIRDPAAFLQVATRNLVRDRMRAAMVRPAPAIGVAASEEVPCGAPSVERVLIAQQRVAALEKALRELPMKRRTALVLHRFDDLSHAQIAERLGMSVSMVEKHIRSGLAYCRKRLEEAEIDGGSVP